MVCSFLLFPVPLCHLSAVIPPFWIFVKVSADNSFPDFRSPFPVPRSPLPVSRFSNIQRKEGSADLTDSGYNIYPSCRGGTEWFSFPGSGLQSLANRVRAVLNDAGVLASTSDWVESSINPSLSPNQSPQSVYNSKWRQVPCKGDELQHITYNCK